MAFLRSFSPLKMALHDGCYIAGFLGYEAGYHFEPAAMRSAGAHETAGDLPFIGFGVYRNPLVRPGSGSRGPYGVSRSKRRGR